MHVVPLHTDPHRLAPRVHTSMNASSTRYDKRLQQAQTDYSGKHHDEQHAGSHHLAAPHNLSSVLGEGVGSDGVHGEGRLPGAEQWVRDLRDVDGLAGHLEDLEHAGEHLQAGGQLAVARAQDGVAAVHPGQLGFEGGDSRPRPRVLGLEARRLGDQLLEAQLLARAGAARRLPVGERPLALALVGGVAVRAGAPARRRRHDRIERDPFGADGFREDEKLREGGREI
jgi:hypothetical protein